MANQFNFSMSKDEIANINTHLAMQYAQVKSVGDIVDEYNISRVRLHQLINEGRIPGTIKIGKAYFFDMIHADKFFDEYADFIYQRYINQIAKTVHYKIYSYLQTVNNVDNFYYIDPYDDAPYTMPDQYRANLYSYAESIAAWRYNGGQVAKHADGENMSQDDYTSHIYASLRAAEDIYEKRS